MITLFVFQLHYCYGLDRCLFLVSRFISGQCFVLRNPRFVAVLCQQIGRQLFGSVLFANLPFILSSFRSCILCRGRKTVFCTRGIRSSY